MESILYEKLENKEVKCLTCNHYCIIKPNKRGVCAVRENKDGTLIALNYNKSIATSIDPIEKKPLYEFLTNTYTYSFATVGCNMNCSWCQNYDISQNPKPNKYIIGQDISAKEHVENAIKYKCPSISYTYSEPTIFLEYALDTMKLARKHNLKNIWVSNGYMSSETLELILPYLDAVNIDYKGDNEVYKKYCGGNNIKVLENLNRMKQAGVHVEVTTLLIPGVNDSSSHVESIAKDLLEYLGRDFIWHITRFFPNYKMINISKTEHKALLNAKRIGNNLGIKKIYLGNI
ncbi:AmmeMemoRadiSam system radical SAM enzyme [Mycoplasmatota bacterium WC30]